MFALKEILGHTDLKMTAKYVALADADLASQRRFSPADQLAGQASGKPQTWSKDGGRAGGRPTRPRAEKTVCENAGPASNPKKITQSKLTESQVREIKAKLKAPNELGKAALRAEIAIAYGISAAAVKEIDLGYSWRHVE